MPLAMTTDPPGFQYVFILSLKRDGTLVLALFGGEIDMSSFAAAVEEALHGMYYLEGASKSFHLDFESYDSLRTKLGIQCEGSCFNCGAMGKNFPKCKGCHFVRYCGKQCQRQHWKSGHRSSCSFIKFDHRRRRLPEHLAVWGTVSGYDFDLWIHLAGQRAREMLPITHVCNLAEDGTSFSRVDAACVALC